MYCCGPRSSDEHDDHLEHPSRRAKPSLTSKGGFGRLLVDVERGEEMRGMDTSVNFKRMTIDTTSDLFLELSINDSEPFAKTDIKYGCPGNPQWDESFTVDVFHPKCYLCVFVKDAAQASEVLKGQVFDRDCGYVEIPLWELPRNHSVTGWFTLHSPDLAEGTLADRQVLQAADGDASDDEAGRVKLTLRLETTTLKELMAYGHLQPTFETSLPHLDLPQFMEDVFEIKRLLMQRLLGAALGSFSYAVSWSNPVLTVLVLLWHWCLCYHPELIWATFWTLFLLSFCHRATQPLPTGDDQPAELSRGHTKRWNLMDAPGALVKGAEGAVCATVGVVKSGAGAVLSLSPLHAPGMQEFQQILQLKPALRDMVRNVQPVANSKRASLQKVDDLFYWATVKTTSIVVLIGLSALLFSIWLRDYTGNVSGYIWLSAGTFFILSQSTVFQVCLRVFGGAISLFTMSSTPFASCDGFVKAEEPTHID